MAASTTFTLSVDLSGPRGSLAIHEFSPQGNMRCLEEAVITRDGNHSENFLPQLRESLLQSGISLSQIDHFITTVGPGSFTGLRVALASLKGLAYSQQRPIEAMNGAEARALSWIAEQKEASADLGIDELIVLTYLTLDRFICSHFKCDRNGNWNLANETVSTDYRFLGPDKIQTVLLDDRIGGESIPVDDTTKVIKYQAEARYLAETYLRARSRKTYTSIPDWINLVPNYFGSSRY